LEDSVQSIVAAAILSLSIKLLNPSAVVKFFNRSTSILIAAARIALEPSKRISPSRIWVRRAGQAAAGNGEGAGEEQCAKWRIG